MEVDFVWVYENANNASIINTSNYDLIAANSFSPNETWSLFEFDFIALTDLNKLKNPDFFDGDFEWNLNTLSAAEVSLQVFNLNGQVIETLVNEF